MWRKRREAFALNIKLSQWFDGELYPDMLGDREATVGTMATGFHGLIGILETQLGLTRPTVSEVRRIAEWERAIQSIDYQVLPFAKSFLVDPWNTAKELLHRRDELVLSGWNYKVHNGDGKWIDALAKIEAQLINPSIGFADRVQMLLYRLQHPAILNIDSITIVDDVETEWEPWCKVLIETLIRQGIHINRNNSGENKPSSIVFEEGHPVTDLNRFQTAMELRSAVNEAQGDGSLQLVRAENFWDVADYFVSWLETHREDNVVIIRGEGSFLLDQLLHRRGLPALGVFTPSKWRAALQVLPLVIDTYWKPLHVQSLLQLFTLPFSPVPSRMAFRLANVLTDIPGIEGDKWKQALDQGYLAYEEHWMKEGLDSVKIQREQKKLRGRMQFFVEHDRYDPEEGIPIDQFQQLCHLVSQWAISRYSFTEETIYLTASEQALAIKESAQMLGSKRLTHLQVKSLIDTVMGPGLNLPESGREASSWYVVDHPGQIWGSVDTVLWWGFHRTEKDLSIHHWTSAERNWLKDHGIVLADPSLQRIQEVGAWKRAMLFAKKRVIVFAPTKVRGEEVPLHPLWDEICHFLAKNATIERRLIVNAKRLRSESETKLDEKMSQRTRLKHKHLPTPIREWEAPFRRLSSREVESATSLEILLGCPFRWTLQYAANVRLGRALSLPSDPVMMGTLAHEVLRRMMEEKNAISPSEVKKRTGIFYDQLVPIFAAPLLEPQNGVLREQSREMLQTAMMRFFQILDEAEITIRRTEMTVRKQWQLGVEIEGRLDLVGTSLEGTPLLIDAKWSRYPQSYKKRLEGLSTQLTIYHWLLNDDPTKEIPVAYFIFQNGMLYAHEHSEIPSKYHVKGPSMLEAESTLRSALNAFWQQLHEGHIVAAGIPPVHSEMDKIDTSSSEIPQLVEPPCQFCDYHSLCGKQGVPS